MIKRIVDEDFISDHEDTVSWWMQSLKNQGFKVYRVDRKKRAVFDIIGSNVTEIYYKEKE